MKASCIPNPPQEPLVIIHRWQVDYCDGNHCAAALLQFFIYWHDVKIAMQGKNQQANQIAEIHGEAPTQDESLYQFHTREELKAGLLDLYSADSIKKGITLLLDKGAITKHRNPNPRYQYDNTTHFLLQVDNLLIFLKSRKIVGPPTKNRASNTGKSGLQSGKIVPPTPESRGTIPETSSETPKEITTEIYRSGKNSQKRTAPEPQKATHVLAAERGPISTSSASLSQGQGNAPPDTPPDTPPWPSVEKLVSLYNDICPNDCPSVSVISPLRRKLARHALRSFPEQPFWETVFTNVGKSPLLLGRCHKPGQEAWIADFDWLLAKKDGVENAVKVYDGRYIR